VSSGLGGVYPPGYPVGKVTAVTRDPGQPLLAIEAEPLAGLDRDPEVLLVWFDNAVVEPEPEPEAKAAAPASQPRKGTPAAAGATPDAAIPDEAPPQTESAPATEGDATAPQPEAPPPGNAP